MSAARALRVPASRLRGRAILGALLVLAGCRSAAPGGALPAGEHPGTPAPVRLRVLSLNAWLLPGFSKELQERRERLPAALRGQEPDIVCLQEVWTSGMRDPIAKGLAPDFCATETTRGGLVTLSRFPIVEQEFVPFPVVKGLSVQELLAGKGLLLTVLEAPGGRLRVVNTHLAWDPKPDGARVKQLAFLQQTLAPLTDVPMILAGDLNTALSYPHGRPSAEGLAFRELGFSSADPIAGERLGDLPPGPPLPLAPTRSGWPPVPQSGWTPDHILLRDAFSRTALARDYRVVFASESEALSDHSGLCVDLLLAP